MKKLLLLVLASGAAAFGDTMTLPCAPVNGTNTFTFSQALGFLNAHGTGSFSCSDASLGAVTLTGVSVGIFNDYITGNGTITDPADNSAGFTFTDSASTWASAHPGAFTSTMNLATGVTLFSIGNLSSVGPAFTNTPSGGLGGTIFVPPTTDAMTGTLSGVFSISANAFVDAGAFDNGLSAARVDVTYTYTPTTAPVPEPGSVTLLASGIMGLMLLGRKRLLHG